MAAANGAGAGGLELEAETELSGRLSLEENDITAFTELQQTALNQHKIKTRIENELYMRKHPEITVMLSSFVNDILLKRPEKIREHAAVFFTDPSLPDVVKEKLKVGDKVSPARLVRTNQDGVSPATMVKDKLRTKMLPSEENPDSILEQQPSPDS